MVKMYPPQRSVSLLSTNSAYSPQGGTISNVITDSFLLTSYPPIADDTYQSYRFYRIKKDMVPETQSNMPLLLTDAIPSTLLLEPSNTDIRVFDSAGDDLPYHITQTTESGGNVTFVIWVNVSTVKDLELIQLTFGKVSAGDGSTPNSVYSSNHRMVLHLDDGNLNDSTSNGNNATNNGSTITAGKIGDGRSFDGDDDGLEVTPNISQNITDAITLSIWMRMPTGANTTAWILNKDDPSSGNRPYLLRQDTANLIFGLDLASNGFTNLTANSVLLNNVYQFVVGTYEGATMRIFVDGDEKVSIEKIDSIEVNNTTPVSIGKRSDNSSAVYYEGNLDEAIIKQGADSPNLIKTQFNNQSDNVAFWEKSPILTNGTPNYILADNGDRIII